MDYKQSLKNFNRLKNFVRCWSECYIFFFFKSETEFINEIFEKDFTDIQNKIIKKNMRSNLPYGFINNEKSGKEILYYVDKNICIEYDLFLHQMNEFYFDETADVKLVRLEYLQLSQILKNK